MKRKFTFMALLLTATAVHAQQAGDPAAPAEDGRRYAVEMIIFAYAQLDSVGNEVFVPELADDDSAVPEFGDTVSTPASDPVGEDTALRYRLLGNTEFTMQETWGRLSRLQAYDPLMHFGWVQETLPDTDAPELALDRFGQLPAGLDGTVSLSLSRFLHLGVDITLAAEGSAATTAANERRSGEFFDRESGDDGVRYAPLRYELREKRIFKSGEIRYYDHPHFGVIAKVWRVDAPESAAFRPD